MKNRLARLRPVAVVAAAALLALSCYTIQGSKKARKIPKSESASKELHETIFDFMQDSLFTYPQVATRVGVHKHKLSSGESVDLDRELPNFSEDVVASRVQTLDGYLERVEAKAPEEDLSKNDLADRKLLVDAIKYEKDMLEGQKAHLNNPMLHVVALAEAVYYPITLEYAPANERAADLLGRMHWMPSFVDRAMRLLEKSSDVYNEPAARMNARTIEMLDKELAVLVEGDEEALASYNGMKPPVLESLNKFQKFLEQDLPKKEKRTWRLGRDRYDEHFALIFHGLSSRSEVNDLAKARMDELREQMYHLAKPIYCENQETDRDVCGPTKAEIAAAKKAEEKRIAEEERKEKAQEERLAKDEAKKAQEAERKQKAQEERERKEEARKAKEEERLAKEEERKEKAQEERERKEEASKAKEEAKEEAKKAKEKGKEKKGDDAIENPYEDKKPEKKKKDDDKEEGITNPYSMGTLRVPTILGAKAEKSEKAEKTEKAEKAEKSEKAEKAEKSEKAEKKVSAATMDKVVGYVVKMIAARKPASTRIDARLGQQLERASKLSAEASILTETGISGLKVETMPAFLEAAVGAPFDYLPQAPFKPEQDAFLYYNTSPQVSSMADLAGPWMVYTALYFGSPGKHQVFKRATEIESQTRRAVRVLHGDPAFVEGWALFSAIEVLSKQDAAEDPELALIALTAELRAAALVIVDSGLHASAWKDDRAVKFMEEGAYMEANEAQVQVSHIQKNPLVATAPFLGLLQWRQVRKDVEDSYGEKFSLRAFGNDALKIGPVPLVMLAQMLIKDPDLAPEDDEEEVDEGDGKKRISIFSKR